MKIFLNVVDLYDLFILDIWGVLHNGKDLFPWTLQTLLTLKKKNKKIALLSNSPRLIHDSKEHLAKKGLTPDFYDFLMTSGQMGHDFLKTSPFKRAFFIGPEHEKNILKDLTMDCVEDIETADFILLTGLNNMPLSSYIDCLTYSKQKKLPMICSNPDLGAMHGDFYDLSAGSLAFAYEQMGGKVLYFGKPFLNFYEYLFEELSKNMVSFSKDKILGVGDNLLTDIKGAIGFGVDSALVLSGITKEEDISTSLFKPKYIFQHI